MLGIQSLGGAEGISNKLKVNVETGLSGNEFPDRTAWFGHNIRLPAKAKGFCKIFWEQLQDFMLQVLLVAATGSLIFEYIGADPEDYGHAWFDGAAIYLAVLIVSGFSTIVDWRKGKEFAKRQAEEMENLFVYITRVGDEGKPEKQRIHVNHLHVGDIIHLEYGLTVPVDGILIQSSQLQTNEAAMTGESDERRKETMEVCEQRKAEFLDQNKDSEKEGHSLPSPLILSGTDIVQGEGLMMCIVVGKISAIGKIMAKVEEDNDGEAPEQPQTPLQIKLEIIGTEIGKLGTYAAILTIHVLLFRYFLDGLLKRNIDLFGGETKEDSPFSQNLKLWVDYIVIGVAVIVVAVPEGLPLAVMISLAYSQGKMLKD